MIFEKKCWIYQSQAIKCSTGSQIYHFGNKKHFQLKKDWSFQMMLISYITADTRYLLKVMSLSATWEVYQHQIRAHIQKICKQQTLISEEKQLKSFRCRISGRSKLKFPNIVANCLKSIYALICQRVLLNLLLLDIW